MDRGSVWAVTDYNCPHRDGQGRRCGSYGAVVRHTPWLGHDIICRCCGKAIQDDELVPGRHDLRRIRREYDELLAAGRTDYQSGLVGLKLPEHPETIDE